MRSGYVPGNMCLGKLNFGTMENGQRCADISNAQPKNIKKGKQFRPYPCPVCKGVHHSTSPARTQKFTGAKS